MSVWIHRWGPLSCISSAAITSYFIVMRCPMSQWSPNWPFIVTSPRQTCVLILQFNQHLYVPHLSGGWIIWEEAKCSPAWVLTSFCSEYDKPFFQTFVAQKKSKVFYFTSSNKAFNCIYICIAYMFCCCLWASFCFYSRSLSRLGACWRPSIVGITLTMDKYLI